MKSLRWTNEQLKKYGQQIKKTDNRNTSSTTNLEQAISNRLLDKEKNKRFNTPVCVHFHSVRKKLADIDGISGKAALDGVVKAGILQDDKPSIVAEVRHTQEKGKEEKTIITIKPVG